MAQELNAKEKISLIAALSAKDRGIGFGGALLWSIPEDIRRFRELTAGHPVIMGRKTWDSLPEKFRPLPDRTNVVVTRNTNFTPVGAQVAYTLSNAIEMARGATGHEEIFIIGGGNIYDEAFHSATRLYLTVINGEKEADAFFPAYEEKFTEVKSIEFREWEGIRYSFEVLERSA